jgi:hypothetical protein
MFFVATVIVETLRNCVSHCLFVWREIGLSTDSRSLYHQDPCSEYREDRGGSLFGVSGFFGPVRGQPWTVPYAYEAVPFRKGLDALLPCSQFLGLIDRDRFHRSHSFEHQKIWGDECRCDTASPRPTVPYPFSLSRSSQTYPYLCNHHSCYLGMKLDFAYFIFQY